MAMIGFATCNPKLVILSPNASAAARMHFNCCALWCGRTWPGVTGANCFLESCQCFPATCVHTHTPVSFLYGAGWRLNVAVSGKLRLEALMHYTASSLPHYPVRADRRRGWLKTWRIPSDGHLCVCVFGSWHISANYLVWLRLSYFRTINQGANVSPLKSLIGCLTIHL